MAEHGDAHGKCATSPVFQDPYTRHGERLQAANQWGIHGAIRTDVQQVSCSSSSPPIPWSGEVD